MNFIHTTGGWLRFFSGTKKLTSPEVFEVGDRFFEMQPPYSVWTIERIVKSKICDIPHVVIQRSGTMPSSKVISVQVLMNAGSFRRERRDEVKGGVSEKRRRKTDLPHKGGTH